jgi:hypothetical protein
MRRAITEWGLVFSVVLLAGLALIWVGSLFLRALREPLALGTGLYLRVGDSRLCLFTELGPGWKPRFDGTDPQTVSWPVHYSNSMFPGFEYHNRLFASGRTIWSVEVSLVIPAGILLTTMTILWRIRHGGWLARTAARP